MTASFFMAEPRERLQPVHSKTGFFDGLGLPSFLSIRQCTWRAKVNGFFNILYFKNIFLIPEAGGSETIYF